MNALLAQLQYRWKAVIAGSVIAVVGVAEWFVNSPDTAPAIEAVIPAQFTVFVPLVLGAIGTIAGYVAVFFKTNGEKPATTTADAAWTTELPADGATQMIPVQAATDTH